jgi:hypothetical protein
MDKQGLVGAPADFTHPVLGKLPARPCHGLLGSNLSRCVEKPNGWWPHTASLSRLSNVLFRFPIE